MIDIVSQMLLWLTGVWDLLIYIITDIIIIIGIILNPFLFLAVILVLANIYVIIKAKTKSEVVQYYGQFLSMTATGIYTVIISVTPIIISIVSTISNLVGSVMTAPSVATVAGTGISPGAGIALILIVIFALYSLVSFL